jgi:hypothetical protein
VFTTSIGTMLDRHNIRCEFRQITKTAGLGEDWVPRELRHTFVSIMSAGGVPVEEIAWEIVLWRRLGMAELPPVGMWRQHRGPYRFAVLLTM